VLNSEVILGRAPVPRKAARQMRYVPGRKSDVQDKLAQASGVLLDNFLLTVLVLVAALPSASSIPMLAERFGADAGRIARIVLFATAASFVSFSAVVALLV
jgi:hypothetical protein